ncbi:MAG: hypothetical protein JXA62_03405 [Candidatus Aminicenantes bacterium]|nr:hypothetical protein [Candidatus Aminicenantes bacterium]
MHFRLRIFLMWLIPAAGLAGLAFERAVISLPAQVTLVLALAATALWHPDHRRARAYRWLSLGVLIWPARLTYWDAVEFSLRASLLCWIVALALVLNLLGRYQTVRRVRIFFDRLPVRRRMVVLFVMAWLLLAAGAAGITLGGIPLLGDEPHYLVIAQSLVRDGDLNVANQYAQHQYRRFLPAVTMGIHGYFGWKDSRFQARFFRDDLPPPEGAFIYSIHLPGVAVAMVPMVMLPLTPPWWSFFLRAWLGLFGAGVVVMAYLFALRLSRRRNFAFQLSLVALFTPPLFFHAIHAYPEVQVLFLLLLSLYLLLYARNRSIPVLIAGLLLGLILFWGLKYSIFVWAFVVGFSMFFLWKRRFGDLGRLLVFPLLFQALFLGYLFHAYGNFSPMSVYMNYTQKKQFSDVVFHRIPHQVRIETLLDYFLDQRDGLLPYAPVFFLVFPGLWLALRNWKRYRIHLLLAIPAAVFVLNYAFLSHRGGQSPQARPLIPVIWALMVFVWIYLREGPNQWMRRAWRWLPLYAAGVTVFQVIHPWTLYQPTTHNVPIRSGLMFQILSPLGIRLDELLPSFAKMPGNWDWWPNPVWLCLLAGLGVLALRPLRVRKRLAGFAVGVAAVMGLILGVLLPRVPDYNPTLVTGEGMMLHRLLGASQYPRRVEQRKFELKAGKAYSFTLQTSLPVGTIEVVWDGNGRAPFQLKLFDAAVASRTTSGWMLRSPRFRRYRNHYYYRLHLIPGAFAGQGGTLEIRPQRKS